MEQTQYQYSSTEIYKAYFKTIGKSFDCDLKNEPKVVSIPLLAKYYDNFLFDGFGTFYDKSGLYDYAEESLMLLRQHFKQIRLVTNSGSLTIKEIQKKLSEDGLYFHPTEIISSGSLFKTLNSTLRISEAFHLGADSSKALVEDGGVALTTTPDQPIVILNSQDFTESDFEHAEKILRKDGALLIVLNPDAFAPLKGENPYPTVGYYGWDLHKRTDCRILHLGKPYPLIYTRALQSLIPSTGSVIMIGDTLGTDIAGANLQGIDTALVLTGNGAESTLRDEEYELTIRPTYYLNNLKAK
ncbi:MAG: HAD hydrolase-like protein [Fibrobacterales bacterium]